MRVPLWTTVGALVAVGVATGCTRTEDKPAASASPAVAATAAAAQAPAAPAAEEGDEILMVWAEAEPDEGAPPLAVQLKADISGGTGERKVKWDFGDGSGPSSEVNPKHTYEKAGSYRASVEVSDGGGDSDSDYVDIEVGTD
jgi:PKD repeat protein